MKAHYCKYILNFKKPSGTSRGVLLEKETWFLIIEKEGKIGIGECGILRGLSCDDRPDYEDKLKWVCKNIHLGEKILWENLLEFPSIQFGVEIAFLSLASKNPFILFESDFTWNKKGIPINGLVWMGNEEEMKIQIDEKLRQDFKCIKIKIGAIEFEKELQILHYIRQNYDENLIEIRLDANGAFSESEVLDKINQIADFKISSIEQPIQKKQPDKMTELCKSTPVNIALDEEIIGIFTYNEKVELLTKIKPQAIVLKPSFIGGFRGTNEWINIAEQLKIEWWITSALESNIGLNAIAQYTFTKNVKIFQGLGTGELYTNNLESPLYVKNGHLNYLKENVWEVNIGGFKIF